MVIESRRSVIGADNNTEGDEERNEKKNVKSKCTCYGDGNYEIATSKNFCWLSEKRISINLSFVKCLIDRIVYNFCCRFYGTLFGRFSMTTTVKVFFSVYVQRQTVFSVSCPAPFGLSSFLLNCSADLFFFFVYRLCWLIWCHPSQCTIPPCDRQQWFEHICLKSLCE